MQLGVDDRKNILSCLAILNGILALMYLCIGATGGIIKDTFDEDDRVIKEIHADVLDEMLVMFGCWFTFAHFVSMCYLPRLGQLHNENNPGSITKTEMQFLSLSIFIFAFYTIATFGVGLSSLVHRYFLHDVCSRLSSCPDGTIILLYNALTSTGIICLTAVPLEIGIMLLMRLLSTSLWQCYRKRDFAMTSVVWLFMPPPSQVRGMASKLRIGYTGYARPASIKSFDEDNPHVDRQYDDCYDNVTHKNGSTYGRQSTSSGTSFKDRSYDEIKPASSQPWPAEHTGRQYKQTESEERMEVGRFGRQAIPQHLDPHMKHMQQYTPLAVAHHYTRTAPLAAAHQSNPISKGEDSFKISSTLKLVGAGLLGGAIGGVVTGLITKGLEDVHDTLNDSRDTKQDQRQAEYPRQQNGPRDLHSTPQKPNTGLTSQHAAGQNTSPLKRITTIQNTAHGVTITHTVVNGTPIRQQLQSPVKKETGQDQSNFIPGKLPHKNDQAIDDTSSRKSRADKNSSLNKQYEAAITKPKQPVKKDETEKSFKSKSISSKKNSKQKAEDIVNAKSKSQKLTKATNKMSIKEKTKVEQKPTSLSKMPTQRSVKRKAETNMTATKSSKYSKPTAKSVKGKKQASIKKVKKKR